MIYNKHKSVVKNISNIIKNPIGVICYDRRQLKT